MQQTFQRVRVLDVPRHPGIARLQEGLHLVEQSQFDERLVRAGMQCTFVADDACVVRIRQLVERVLLQRFGRTCRRRNHRQPASGQVAQ